MAAHQASHPWDSPGKNTGAGCHFLLQCMKVKSESEVAQSCPTLATPWVAAYRLLRPWDFLGKSTGMGCHCLLLIPSRVFLISVIVLLVSVCLFFNSSRSLLIDSCIFSILSSKFLIIFTIIIMNSFFFFQKVMILIRNLNVLGGRDPLGRDNYFYLRELCLERIEYFKAN